MNATRAAVLGAVIAAQTEEDITPARIDCSATSELLHGTDIECLPVAQILAKKFASYMGT
jgi:hypothetical protein